MEDLKYSIRVYTGFKIDPLEAMALVYEAFSRLRELHTSFP